MDKRKPSSSTNKITLSGGLLRIFSLGVLIRGDSGMGKSESALELISRGHRFISDDVTEIRKKRDGKLTGTSPPLSRYFMEVRGLGIINIEKIFGPRSISQKADLDLIIQLKDWEHGRDYDRLGLKFPEDCEILGMKIPQISIPVAPGRNIATLIEVACKVHTLKKRGYLAPQELSGRLDRTLSGHKYKERE